jgi:hypothetical protein
MTDLPHLSPGQLSRLRVLASVLLPGSHPSPAAGDLEDFDQLVFLATGALRREFAAITAAVEALPATISRDSVLGFSQHDPESFELISLVLVGAYFMAARVKDHLGLPTGPRYAPSFEQIADELLEGLIDPVLDRISPIRTLDDVRLASN